MAAPKVYLSPAMHWANPCVYPREDGRQCYEALENNEYIDILEPILRRCGIETKRGYRRVPLSNEDGDTIMRQNVAESDAWGADVHYVSHTNGSADGKGNSRGCYPMYYTYSKNGKKLGNIMVQHRKEVYPGTVKLVASSKWYELYKPKAVSYYEEHAFHDNKADAAWFHQHMTEIAESAGTLCSRTGIRGILKKVGYLVIVAVAMGADYLLRYGLDQVGVHINIEFLIAAIVIVWLIINELISILENVAAIGAPVPEFLLKLIKKLKTVTEKQAETVPVETEGKPEGAE